MSDKMNILISGGGTGGHIFPALAIANELKARLGDDTNFLFVGAKGKMEMEKVPQAGYQIEGLWISGLQRKLDLKNLSFPFKVIDSLRKASKIIRKFKPDVAIGTGGYASGPLLYVASRKKIPTLIQEQNSFPGITNKMLGRSVNIICVAFEGMEKYFPAEKICITGNPIRNEISHLKPSQKEGLKFFGLKTNKPTLLIIGGSQGAYQINKVIGEKLNEIIADGNQVIWQTGKYSYEMAKEAASTSKHPDHIKVVDFILKMDLAYAAADLIVSRAGAIAIAEIIAVKKPAIFVPLPSAAEDHQSKNAMQLVNGHAALMVGEQVAGERLSETIIKMMKSKQNRLVMVQNLQRFEHPQAAEKIADEVLKLIKK